MIYAVLQLHLLTLMQASLLALILLVTCGPNTKFVLMVRRLRSLYPVTFSSALDALTSEEYLPVGDAVLNGGPNGPWTKVNFRAGTANAVYVPDLFAATNPGEYSGIVISQAGYYIRLLLRCISLSRHRRPRLIGRMLGRRTVNIRSLMNNSFTPKVLFPCLLLSLPNVYSLAMFPLTILLSLSPAMSWVHPFKVNGGVGEPTNEDIEGYIAKIIIWVEAVELSELQLLG